MYLISQIISSIPIIGIIGYAVLLCVGARENNGRIFFGGIAAIFLMALAHIWNWWA